MKLEKTDWTHYSGSKTHCACFILAFFLYATNSWDYPANSNAGNSNTKSGGIFGGRSQRVAIQLRAYATH